MPMPLYRLLHSDRHSDIEGLKAGHLRRSLYGEAGEDPQKPYVCPRMSLKLNSIANA